ncbi:MAG: putative peptide zinc metalloprotease protein [Gaiellaceae bacterium]|jgi:putative peptide zinc metalloprotease protein|nr:putative peptide zinc metalloprotease protein [Gaiellaceae bacterium]
MSSRRLLLLLLTLAVVLGLPGHAAAGSDDGDNAAVAINTKDGSSLFEFAFSLTKVTGDVVDNENAAVAYASCENCRTTAIAIQIVLIVGSPSTVTPKNYAVSVNENCSLCQTFATAFQFVIGVEDASVGLTRQGERELRQILREFKALKREEYTLEEFHAKTQALGARLRTVLKTQLVSKRHRSDDDDGARLDSERQSDETEQPAPPPAPPAEETTQTTTDPTTTTMTEPATTETQPTTTETTPPETTTTP